MEIHLKIKKSKKELEALENQEKEVSEMKQGLAEILCWLHADVGCHGTLNSPSVRM